MPKIRTTYYFTTSDGQSIRGGDFDRAKAVAYPSLYGENILYQTTYTGWILYLPHAETYTRIEEDQAIDWLNTNQYDLDRICIPSRQGKVTLSLGIKLKTALLQKANQLDMTMAKLARKLIEDYLK